MLLLHMFRIHKRLHQAHTYQMQLKKTHLIAENKISSKNELKDCRTDKCYEKSE